MIQTLSEANGAFFLAGMQVNAIALQSLHNVVNL